MRIWTLHPRYLDPQGLVALWRETLLAQSVLRGQTKGYQNHPQLQRFKAQCDPVSAVAQYLSGVCEEASRRGYRFDASKIAAIGQPVQMSVTTGQLEYEWQHLLAKLQQRSPELHARWCGERQPGLHPMFNHSVPGPVADWERV